LSDIVIRRVIDRVSSKSTSNVANFRWLRRLLARDADVDTSLLIA
jgi:hypothetical protein